MSSTSAWVCIVMKINQMRYTRTNQLPYLKRPYVVEFTNVSTDSLVHYVQVNSSISANGSISIYVNFLRDVFNVYVKTVITVASADQVYDLELINKSVNFCEFLRNGKYEPILQVLYKIFNKNRSFPTSCPVRKVCMVFKHIVTPLNNSKILFT